MRCGDFAVTRAAVLTVVVMSLSLAGHAAASADLPSALGVLLAFALSAGLTVSAIAKPRSWAWLVGYLLGAQALIHVVLVVSGTGHHAGTAAMVPLVPSASMALAHVTASLLAACVLAGGERTVRSWKALLSAALGIVAAPGLAVDQPTAIVVDRDRWVAASWDAGAGTSRRGPPGGVLV